jgi:hypothetical protein
MFSFGMRAVRIHISLENRLHPRNMPFAAQFEKVGNVLFKPEVHGLLWS